MTAQTIMYVLSGGPREQDRTCFTSTCEGGKDTQLQAVCRHGCRTTTCPSLLKDHHSLEAHGDTWALTSESRDCRFYLPRASASTFSTPWICRVRMSSALRSSNTSAISAPSAFINTPWARIPSQLQTERLDCQTVRQSGLWIPPTYCGTHTTTSKLQEVPVLPAMQGRLSLLGNGSSRQQKANRPTMHRAARDDGQTFARSHTVMHECESEIVKHLFGHSRGNVRRSGPGRDNNARSHLTA